MCRRKLRCQGGVALLLFAAPSLSAQVPSRSPFVAAEGCPSGINFEQQQYRIEKIIVSDPFDFLFWIRRKVATTQSQLAAKLEGQPFTYQSAVTEALTLIEAQRMLPENVPGFRVTVEIVSATNCRRNPNTLDLKYGIYST